MSSPGKTDSAGFRVEVDEAPEGVTVTVSGEIDLATIPRLEHARDRALAGNPTCVLIDLRDVRFIDSSGLKFLIETDRLSRSGGWTLKLFRPAGAAMRAFVVTGIDKHLPFVEPNRESEDLE
jgi:anti-anti-sigma factor